MPGATSAAQFRAPRSDFAVYQHLIALDRADVPECHPLHYLPMADEKVSKAAFGALGIVTDPFSHVDFSHVRIAWRGGRLLDRFDALFP